MKKVVWGALFVLLQVFGLQAAGDGERPIVNSLRQIAVSKIVQMYEDDEKIVLSRIAPTYKDGERVGSKTYSLAMLSSDFKRQLISEIMRPNNGHGLFESTSKKFPRDLRSESANDDHGEFCNDVFNHIKKKFPNVAPDKVFAACSGDYRYVGILIGELLEVWEMKNRTFHSRVLQLQFPAYFIEFNFDGSRLVSVGPDGTMCLWDVAAGKSLWDTKVVQFVWQEKKRQYIRQEAVAKVRALEFSPLGYCFAVVTDDGFFRIYEVDSGRMVKYSPRNVPGGAAGQNVPYIVKFSDDGLLVATRNHKAVVYVWEIKQAHSALLENLLCHVTQQEPVLGPLGSLTDLADALAAESRDDTCAPLCHLAGLVEEDSSYEDMPGLIAD
jgi:WD40 repeat protein